LTGKNVIKTDPIIKVENLTAGYTRSPIIKDLSVDFARGKVSTIVGISGCGKSTLLKTIIGLLRPWEGKTSVDGNDLNELEGNQLTFALSKIGLLFQAGAMLNSITVAENVALPLKEHTKLPMSVIREIVRLKLDMVGLGHAMEMLPSELSGGMRKRAALARAMVLDPAVLLCDEPSAGLDPQTAASLDELILSLQATFKMTVVVVTHELASIDKIADDVVMLGVGGNLLFDGSLEDAKKCEVPEVINFFARNVPSQSARTNSLLAYLEERE
jgi:phospholipid/cholesterol/gamma-HCH transport system ATP-binding protein